jgi:hypothetical protein
MVLSLRRMRKKRERRKTMKVGVLRVPNLQTGITSQNVKTVPIVQRRLKRLVHGFAGDGPAAPKITRKEYADMETFPGDDEAPAIKANAKAVPEEEDFDEEEVDVEDEDD